jgi:predicted O-linked N-acetylglucosamine transferase (SPINDLY family)
MPDYAEAHNNRGTALNDLMRLEEAIASYDKAIALKPDFAAAHNNRGVVLNDLMRPEEAIASYDKAIALKLDFAEAHYNRGAALNALRCLKEAIASYDKAIALKQDYAEAYFNRGNALRDLNRPEEALVSYGRAIALKPEYDFLYGTWLHTKMTICDWRNFKSEVDELIGKLKDAKKASVPFSFLSISGSLELQRKAAEIWTLAKYPENKLLHQIVKRQRRKKIRIGYFSADFREHPVAILTAELFERHNRSQFEIIAFSFDSNTKDDMRQRLKTAFDNFIDVSNRSDREVTLLARDLEIDIAVDLGGLTKGNRTRIFAMRAAPVQVNYLGYSGTMGANYIDYLIADTALIPAPHQKYYSEKVVYLPHSYMPNDPKRIISDRLFDRAKLGLPQSGFVFCCFNNSYKLNPSIFDRWMSILYKVEGSVLWLSDNNLTAVANLKREASIRGVNPERLVFAKRMPLLSDHLARHPLADLFLDTLPCNAHATTCDALWAGLPVLTCIGDAFAGRVAASLLTAIDLPELITSTPQQYETIAIELANNPVKLQNITRKLAKNRLTAPLFNIQLYTKHIEAAYAAMYDRYQADLPPDHIYVPQ